jgi:hydrogenase expression/formation protein HypD
LIPYLDEFRDGKLAQVIAARIVDEVLPGRRYRLMEFCGGHTHAIFRYGVQDLLPPAVELIHGPGCPVCVLPVGRIDNAIELARRPGVILASYADMLRVPASGGMSLLKARAQGADVRMVYAASDALKLAQDNPQREVVFFAIGFETTTPPTALVIRQAAGLGLRNFTVFCNHVLTPPAMAAIVDSPDGAGSDLDGFIGPAHVSTVIGTQPYEQFVAQFDKPVVIAGFEPLDVLQAVLMLVRQINAGRALVENEYSRAVTPEGNRKAQAAMADVFELRDAFEWRGLGLLPHSALRIRERYAAIDAEKRFAVPPIAAHDHKACECGAVLRGVIKPQECKVFGTVCTPDNPIGACMVSSEGACAAWYSYGRLGRAQA